MASIVLTFVVFFGGSFGISSILLKRNAHLHNTTSIGRVHR